MHWVKTEKIVFDCLYPSFCTITLVSCLYMYNKCLIFFFCVGETTRGNSFLSSIQFSSFFLGPAHSHPLPSYHFPSPLLSSLNSSPIPALLSPSSFSLLVTPSSPSWLLLHFLRPSHAPGSSFYSVECYTAKPSSGLTTINECNAPSPRQRDSVEPQKIFDVGSAQSFAGSVTSAAAATSSYSSFP